MQGPRLLAGAGVPAARFPHAEQICAAEEKVERREGAERGDRPQLCPARQVLGFIPLPPEPAPSPAPLCPGTRPGLRLNPAPVPGRVLGQPPGNSGHQIPGWDRTLGTGRSGQGAWDRTLGTGCLGWGARDRTLGTGRSGHPIPAAGSGPESSRSAGSWGPGSAPPSGAFWGSPWPRPPGAPAPPIRLVQAERREFGAADMCPQGPQGSLGWTGRAGTGMMGFSSPRDTQIWG